MYLIFHLNCEEIIIRGYLKFVQHFSCKQRFFNQIIKGTKRMKTSNKVSKSGIKY